MGTWDAGSFDNDTAADWAGELVDGGSPDTVRETLQTAVDDAAEGDLDADAGAEALAAAEVVAAAAGRPVESTPYAEDALAFAAQHPDLADPATVDLARAAVEAVLGPSSELRATWSEDGPPAPDWLAAVEDLKRRLT